MNTHKGLLDNVPLSLLAARHKSLHFRPGGKRRRDPSLDAPHYRWVDGEWVKR